MEPFSSTTVGSEIHYQCQTGFIPEERTTLLCGEDGRWNPDPQGLCTGKELLCLSFHYHISVRLSSCSREQFIYSSCHNAILIKYW